MVTPNARREASSGRARRRRAFWVWPAAALLAAAPSAGAAGRIEIEFRSAYNLVVDSNVCSPSTYAPQVATAGVGFCNYGDAPLTDVVARIGDFAAKTPGVYPTRDSSAAGFNATCLADSGLYSLSHLGDPVDAVRYIGDLAVGECSWQYWSFTYPRLENGQQPGSGCDSPVWCETNQTDDDLWLTFDAWATSAEGPARNATHTVTMRNEISASANKIYPNDGVWYTDPPYCLPGQSMVTNGINYELGVVNQGFDNDGDGNADYNAWLQPIGAGGWNPACFRLVRTSGQLTVGRPGNPTEYVDFEDQLYFTNLGDNNGITGVVYYEFMCLGGYCEAPMSPYQEAASGSDNEKFAGDYGASVGKLVVNPPSIDFDKTLAEDPGASLPGIAEEDETLTFTMSIENTGAEALGSPDLGMPLVIRDSVPAGTAYVSGSADATFACCPMPDGVKILFSWDHGVSWSSTEPPDPTAVTDLQWRLQSPLQASASGDVTFQVTVDNPYLGDPVILNTAAASFGDSPPFDEDTEGIPVAGPNSIGDTVFADDGGVPPDFLSAEASNGTQGGSEVGIDGVGLTLYWDRNGDGALDPGDVAVARQDSASGGAYLFAHLRDGDYLVVADAADPQIPEGYRSTTGTTHPVTRLGVGDASPVAYLDADFGFGPTLVVEKAMLGETSPTCLAPGSATVTYDVTVTNRRPADTQCNYTMWGENVLTPDGKPWTNDTAASGPPDGEFAIDNFANAKDTLRLGGFNLVGTPPGEIQQVWAVAILYLDGMLVDDNLFFEVYQGGASPIYTSAVIPLDAQCEDGLDNDGDGLTDLNDPQCTTGEFGMENGSVSEAIEYLNPLPSNARLVAFDVTAALPGGWSYADFAGLQLQLVAQKSGSEDGRLVYADAVGFRFVTDRLCGQPGDDLTVVPLEDQYDDTALTFLAGSAIACGEDRDGDGEVCGDADDRFFAPTSTSSCTGGPSATCEYPSAGILQWDDIGPLYAGESQTFRLTFSTAAGGNAQNTAMICGPTGSSCQALFSDGTIANQHQDPAAVCALSPSYSIGDRIWHDANSNRLDDSEPGIPGVSVRLYRDVDNDGVYSPGVDVLLQTTTTDSTGAYLFSNQVAGEYVVVVDASTVPDTSLVQTYELDCPAGAGCTQDSQSAVTVTNANRLDVDFGYHVDNLVYGNVFFDFTVANGIWDGIDHGLEGWTVQLMRCNNSACGSPAVAGTTTTDPAGFYLFGNAPNCTGNNLCYVQVLPAGGVTQTADPDQPGIVCSACDSRTATFTLSGGTVRGAYDFGYTQSLANTVSTIGDTVFEDWDGDGVQGAGEGGIAGVTVYLYQDDGDGVFSPLTDTLRGTEVTDASGHYLFSQMLDCGANGVCEGGGGDDTLLDSGFPAGQWFVWVDDTSLRATHQQTADPDESGACSHCNGIGTAITDGVTDLLTQDFGYQPRGYASIGDYVWRDDDADGRQAAGEPGIGSVTVRLYVDNNANGIVDAGDALVATTLTDYDGSYLFENLYGGSAGNPVHYLVDVDQTDADIPRDCGADFDCTTAGDNLPYVLTSGADPIAVTFTSSTASYRDADFGFARGGVIGDTIFNDLNGDGYQSGTDAGIPGVTVNLRFCGTDGVCGNGDDIAVYRTATTDANGHYAFVGLPGAVYRVEVDETTGGLPTYTPTYDRDVSPPACTVADPCDGQTRIVLGTGQTVLFADFGYQRLAGFVGDFVWYDMDGDGVQDADEPGIGGVEVCLQDCGGTCQNGDPWTCQVTDPDGLYSFRLPSIAAGNRYTIQVTDSTLPGGAAEWTQTADPDGAPPATSLEFQIDANGLITTSGVTNPGLDFGFDRPPLPIITIDKDTSTPRSTAGGTVTFTMVARNPSTTQAQRVRLRDDLTAWGSASCQPNCARLADTDATPGCQVGQPTAVTISADASTVRQAAPAPVDPVCGANDLTWGYWTVAPGGFVSIQYTLDVASTISAGVYDNTALGGYDRDANGTEDTLFDDVGTVAQDPDTPTAQDPEADEDVTIGVELAVSKTCSLAVDADGDGRVDPNDQVLFTINVQNTGVGDATIFSISDGVPLGTSYDTGSSELVAFRDWVNVVQYRDDFEAGSSTRETPPASYVYPDGEDTVPGSESWATAWSDPCTGCTPAATFFDQGDLALELRDKSSPRRSALAHREAGQPGYATRATLSFDYRREAIDAADTLTVTACGTAVSGSPITGSGADTTDAQYSHFSVDISSLLPAAAGNCEIVFETSNLGPDESFLIDNVQLERKERVTRPQGADPVPFPADPPPLLVPSADNRELLPGESMVAAFTVTADAPLPIGLGSIQNTVAVQASELADPVTDTCSLPVELPPSPGSIAGTVWEDVEATPDGVRDAGEPLLENVRIELYSGDCASSCTLAAVTLTDAAGNYQFSDLPAGSYTLALADWTLPPAFAQSGDYDEASPPRCSTCDGRAFLTGARVLQPAESRTGVDFGYYHQIVPLPVTLALFSAEGDPSEVTFSWTTATETGNVGFQLYGLVDDGWAQLSENLIPSHVVSSIEPQQYRLRLSGVGSGPFVLADVDVRGKTRYHGPFSLGVPVGVDVRALAKPIRWDVIGKQHVARWERRERRRRARSRGDVWLAVKQDGLYRVGYEDLMAQGIDLTGVPLAQLALLDRFGPVPILVEGQGQFGPGSAIVFAGKALDSLYTDTHVYTLRVDLASALRVRRINGRPPRRAGVTTTYQETVRIENDKSYHHGATNGDPWYDQALVAFRAPVTVTVPVPVDHLAPGRGSLTVGTWGMNDWPESPDHHLKVSLNAIPVADELFDGFADHPVTVGLIDGILHEGSNDVVLTLPFDQGVAWDLIALDSTSITYPRYLVARAGQLGFAAEADALRVDGLPGPEVTVFRQRGGETDALRRVEVSGTPGAYSATFAGSAEPATFLVATAESFLTPGIEPAPPRNDITQGSAQYLIVSHGDFIEGLAPLVEAREQTMSVKVVDIDDVYASFSGGNVDPEAIRDYVKVAVRTMGTEYLLLVGGDTFDYKNVSGLDSVSFIPSIYAATHPDVQFAPADPLYGDVDDDGVPDIAVGRLPVRTAEELDTVIAKTLAYAHKDYGRTLLSVSDGYDAANQLSFLDASEDLLARVDPSWSVVRADVDTLGVSATRSRLISSIDQGVALVEYIGHSGHLYWSQSSLLSTAQAAQLQNAGRPTVVAQWGCWNTYYVLPGTDTLGQTLLLSGDQGAAAVLGATSLTTNASHLELGIRLLPKAMTPGVTLGRAVLEAKRELAAVHPEMVDVIIGWSLLGDPALVLTDDVSP